MSVFGRLRETVEESLGIEVLPRDEAIALREDIARYSDLEDQGTELAELVYDSLSQDGRELNPWGRRTLETRARRAWERDPIAGTEAEHYANFALSKGVSAPTAQDKDVQKVIEEAWNDPLNQDEIFGFDALRAISHELRVVSNLWPVAFESNGRVRFSFVPNEDVVNIVYHPKATSMPLYYVVRHREMRWDLSTHSMVAVNTTMAGGRAMDVRYIPHFRNLEMALEHPVLKRDVPKIPRELIGDGKMHHIRVNRLLHHRFGTPYAARTLRFMSALNQMLSARVSMQKAASSIIAKRVITGGKSDVERSAEQFLRQQSDIASSRAQRLAESKGRNPKTLAGSTVHENEASRLEAIRLDSGAGNAEVDVRVIRAAATAPSGMGQHYFGDAGSANLATASAQELPAQMATGAHQEIIEGLLRWATDRAIEVAVRAGRLGGRISEVDGDRPLSSLRLAEAAGREAAERRTGKNLSYSFNMPYPGRRSVGDVTSLWSTLMGNLSPIGENEILTETMLTFVLSNGLQLEEASELAQRINARQRELLQQKADAEAGGGAAPPPEFTDAGETEPAEGESRYGERQNGTDMEAMSETETLPAELESQLAALYAEVDAAYQDGLIAPALDTAVRLNGASGPAAPAR